MENNNTTAKNIGQSKCIRCKHRLMDSNSHDKIRVYVFNRADTKVSDKIDNETFALCGRCADLLDGNDNYSPQTICARLKNAFKYLTQDKEGKFTSKNVGPAIKKHIE